MKNKELAEILRSPIQTEAQQHPYIYAVIDGVKHKMLWGDLEEADLVHDMLFREASVRQALFSAAPYLLRLEFDEEKGRADTMEILQQCYGAKSSIFLSSHLGFAEVLERMREMFYIYTHEGDKGYMRFYDPAVFREYALQKDPNILYAMFDEIERYWVEGEESDILIEYQMASGSVRTSRHNLSDIKGVTR